MNRSRLARLENDFAEAEDVRPRRPATEEEERQLFIDALPELCAEAFGEDDERADAAYLAALPLAELHSLYSEAMDTSTERAIANGEMDWFKALPLAEQIRLCRQPEINRDEIERLRREYEVSRRGRPNDRATQS